MFIPTFPIFKCVCDILTPFMRVPIIIIHHLGPHVIALEIGQPSNVTLASLNADVHKRGRATQKIRSFVMEANSCAQSKLILEHKKIKAARNVWELLWFLGNKLIVNIIFLMLKVGNILVILFWLWLIFTNILC